MKLHELTEHLESIAPPYLQESYDNSGLIVGDPEAEVKGILLCLDSTEDVVREAKKKGCNVVIAHHPVIFRGIKQLTPATYVERTVRMAVKEDINIYAIHTNLDNVLVNGVNGKIADKLGLEKRRVLLPKANTQQDQDKEVTFIDTGAGVVGELPEPLDERAFLDYLKKRMELTMIRHTPLLGKKAHRIAVCGGSGAFLIRHAIRAHADFYITGDVKYHEFFDADGRIVIADIGHYESEWFTTELLNALIREKFPNFAPLIAETITNPLNYY